MEEHKKVINKNKALKEENQSLIKDKIKLSNNYETLSRKLTNETKNLIAENIKLKKMLKNINPW